jgi:hypothetical protein
VLAIALPAARQTGQRPLSPISSGTSTRVFRRTSRTVEGMLIGPAIGAAYVGLHPARADQRGDSVVAGALMG